MGQIQYVLGTVVGLVAAVSATRYLKGAPVWLMTSDRAAFAVLFVLALVMCSFGIQAAVARGEFRLIALIIGGVVGIPALVMSVMVMAGSTPAFFGNARNAVVALTVVMGAKWLLASMHLVVAMLRA